MAAIDRVARARSLIGTRFTLNGRSVEEGLDCVGLIALVTGKPAPLGYSLRNSQFDHWIAYMDDLFERRIGFPQAGDILLLRPTSVQLHLGLWTGDSLIHAHAGARRVVETPGRVDTPILGIWF
jgi:murein DD-endopeptidase / murein LD-carboxypeptidase